MVLREKILLLSLFLTGCIIAFSVLRYDTDQVGGIELRFDRVYRQLEYRYINSKNKDWNVNSKIESMSKGKAWAFNRQMRSGVRSYSYSRSSIGGVYEESD